MNAATSSSRPSLLLRALTGALSAAIALSSIPAAAATSATPATPATFGMFAPAAPATAGNVVGVMRLGGDPAVAEAIRSQIVTDLGAAGYTAKGVALDIDAAAGKVKCKGGADACVGKVAEWLLKGAKGGAGYDYLIYGSITPGAPSTLVLYDVAKKAKVKEFTPSYAPEDLILPLALPRAVAAALTNYRTPPAPASAEETKILAELDEPAKTPEELRAEADAIRDAENKVTDGQGEMIDTSKITVDLKKDFKKYCRTGPAKPRASKDDPKDLRPACKRGPFFGYWQTRAWVALGLTAGALATAGIFYSLGLAARGPYRDSLDALEASGLQPGNRMTAEEYSDLASQVATDGQSMRTRFIGGDVALLTTVLLAGVLGVIIYQDRTDAKDYIKTEKSLEEVSKKTAKIQNVRGGPILSTTMQGLGFGFNF